MTPETNPTPAEKPAELSDTAAQEDRRLEEEFAALTAEFPQFGCPDQLPPEVAHMASEQGIHLLDAWLRYRWQEEKRVREAAGQRRHAAASSVGPLSRGAVRKDPEPDAFLRAFRSAL